MNNSCAAFVIEVRIVLLCLYRRLIPRSADSATRNRKRHFLAEGRHVCGSEAEVEAEAEVVGVHAREHLMRALQMQWSV